MFLFLSFVVFFHIIWTGKTAEWPMLKRLWNNLSVQPCFLINTLYNYHVLFVVQKGSAMIL